jgi:hypothetical protein
MRAQDLLKEVSEEEAREVAAKSMNLSPEAVRLEAATDRVRVFAGTVEETKWRFFKKRRTPVRAVDREGIIRIQRSDARVVSAAAPAGLDALRRVWEETTIYNGDSVITPDMFVIAGGHIVDLSGVATLDHAIAISRGELEGMAPESQVALIAVQGARGL